MNKLNATIYNKLLLQAEEAKDRGMVKLAAGIFNAIGSCPNEEVSEYSYGQLKDDIHNDLWKLAMRLIQYYDVESADIEKIDETIFSFASKLMDELELSMDIDNDLIGPLDPKVSGQT